MKTTMKLALVCAAAAMTAATFTSCNKDKGGEEPARDEVKIVTSVAGMTATRAPQLDETGQGVFSTGDTFGLLVQVAVNGGEKKRFDYTVGTTKLYWDEMPPLADETKGYLFGAVYPNVPEFTIASTFDFNAATAANPDLLYAGISTNKNGPVKLAFSHAMHKLNVNLTSNYFEADDLAAARVMPLLKSTAMVSPFGYTYPVNASGDTNLYAAKTGPNTSWIVAPQELVANEELVTIWIGDYVMSYKVPAAMTVLKSGEVTTLNLALNRDAVSTEGMDVGQWGTETEVPGTIPVTE